MRSRRIKRDRFYIYYEVLKVLSRDPMRVAHIMRTCNLDTRLYKHVVATLVYRGLVVCSNDNGVKLYHVTNKGLEFIAIFEQLQALLAPGTSKTLQQEGLH